MRPTTVLTLGVTLALTQACVLNPPQRPDDRVEFRAQPYGPTGWDGVQVAVTDVTWEREGKRTQQVWVRVEEQLPADSIEWVFRGPDGTLVDGEFDVVGDKMMDRVVPARDALTPGRWQLTGTINGESVGSQALQIDDFGQDAAFDPSVLHDHVQVVHLPSDSMGGLLVPLVRPLALHVEPADEGTALVSIYAAGKEVPWCRAWNGEANLDERGMLDVQAESLMAGGSVEAEIRDVRLLMGFDNAGEVAGIELLGTIDTRDLDFVFADEEGEVKKGATCSVLSSFGAGCDACEDDAEPFCVTYKAWSGFTDSTVAAPTTDELADAPLCAGPQEGAGVCSTVGTVGIGGWFVGLGLVLFRRRRRPAVDE